MGRRWGEPLKINDEALRELGIVRVRRLDWWVVVKHVLAAIAFILVSTAATAPIWLYILSPWWR